MVYFVVITYEHWELEFLLKPEINFLLLADYHELTGLQIILQFYEQVQGKVTCVELENFNKFSYNHLLQY